MSTTGRFDLDSLTAIHWIAIGLAALTGLLHLVLGVGSITTVFGVLFVLAGLGFFGGIVLVLLGFRRRLVYAVGIPFTGVQIVVWYWLNRPITLPDDATGVADKIAQALLIVVLIALYRHEPP